MSHQGDPRNSEFVSMRYFTPQLVLSLNSSDSNIADGAVEHWEEAILAYRKHLRKLRAEMPVELQQITKLSLHDWNVVGSDRKGGTVVLVLKKDADIVVLGYLLSKKMRIIDAPDGWSFATEPLDWLYDEVDFDTENHKSFVHRVLFSDGTTLVIPFSQCTVTPVHLRKAVSHSDLMQIA